MFRIGTECEKPFGKSTFGKLLSLLPQLIGCIERKFPAKSMSNVAVITRLSPEAAVSRDLFAGFSMVSLFPGALDILRNSFVHEKKQLMRDVMNFNLFLQYPKSR